jgi:hypothetical protein
MFRELTGNNVEIGGSNVQGTDIGTNVEIGSNVQGTYRN